MFERGPLSRCCLPVAATVMAFTGVRKAAGERAGCVGAGCPSVHTRYLYQFHSCRCRSAAPCFSTPPCPNTPAVYGVLGSFYWKNRPRFCKRCWRTCSGSVDLKGFATLCSPLALCDVFKGFFSVSVSQPVSCKERFKASACESLLYSSSC